MSRLTKTNKSPWHLSISRDWLALIISALTLVLLVGTVYYTREQWQTMNRTLGEMHKQTQSASIVAGEAVKQSESTEARFRTDERAWIVVDQIVILKTFPATAKFPTSWKYGIYTKNVGKTVAREVRIHIDTPFGSNITDHGIYLDQMRKYKGMKGKPFGPDRPAPQSLSPGERSAVPVITGSQAPQYQVFTDIIGRIDYIDAFNIKHWKTFCYYPMDGTGTLYYCTSGNNEDHNPELPPKAITK